MTLQSSSSNSEIVSASGPSSTTSSTSTSSTDVFPLPYSIGHKEIVLNNEARTVVADVGENNILSTPGANVSIVESSDVHLGNRTNFNGEVTIYQYINGPNIPNGSVGQDEVECKKTAWKIRTSIMGLALFLVMTILILCAPSNTLFNEPLSNDSDIKEVFVSRSMWGGATPKSVKYTDPATLLIIKHTGGKICFDFKSCSKRIREIQKEHMEVQKMPDIEYNFLIGGDGRIYIGRGWFVQNEGWYETVDIAFIGNFTENYPTEKMMEAGGQLVAQGAAINALDFEEFFIVCHNQTTETESPGKNLFREVTKWKFYREERVIFKSDG